MDEKFDYAMTVRQAWSFTRGLTFDLLSEMSEADLLFLPGPQLGPFWKQFRHVGRVQECYIDALSTGKIDFSPEGKSYDQGPSKQWLQAYLKRLDDSLFPMLTTLDWTAELDWFGVKVRVFDHFLRMVTHETLHHGQWIVYLRLMNKNFPDSWEVWGL